MAMTMTMTLMMNNGDYNENNDNGTIGHSVCVQEGVRVCEYKVQNNTQMVYF